jgi:hypothetical protein
MTDYSIEATPFRAGRVVSRSFTTLFRNILPFGLLALTVTSPTYVYRILAGPPDYNDYESMSSIVVTEIALAVIEIVLSYLVTAALVFGTIEDLRKNRIGVGECFSKGIARMFPVLGVALLSTIVILVSFLPAAAVAMMPIDLPIPSFLAIPLAIPGIFVVIILWVTIPVAVVERRGIGSLGRSMALTKGYRWRIFAVFLILLAIIFALAMLIGVIVAAIMIGGGGVDEISPGAVAMEWILSALIAMFFAVMYAVSYHDLRVAKEGVDTDQIASVFD